MLYLVRHAKAGSRSHWEGDDIDRPLSKGGRRQSERIADRLAGAGVTHLVSSPFVRCVQTLEPLGSRLGLLVVEDERLSETATFDAVIGLLAGLPDGAVASTHGNIVPDVIGALGRRGMEIHGDPNWAKGCVWMLERAGDDFVRATAEPPPSSAR